jgi:hypothetical protein
MGPKFTEDVDLITEYLILTSMYLIELKIKG